ncbi:MAG TPA: Lrp/AsnC family transcriptional regulator [Candidatus Methanomethylia archaeon]|nr:Lrp/AsnC family transcriptional regulator [Candidatus Methanomethylicia archaeon]
MLPVAYALINVEVGYDKEVLAELRKIPEVKEAHLVYGIYDIVAKLEADSIDQLREVVTQRIRRIDRVRSTMTMIAMEG